jgi:hypothetical protein
VVYRYARDELDGRSPEIADDGTRARVVGDESGTAVTREQVAASADGEPDHPRG